MRLLLLLSVGFVVAYGSVMGIDLGSEFMKVALIKPKVGIDVVLNEQTKRKTKTFVGFRGDERYFGEDAQQLQGRFPTKMVTYLTALAGRAYDDLPYWEEYRNDLMFPYTLVNNSRGSVDVEVAPEERYSPEELLGMFLVHAREMAEKQGGTSVPNCVLAVPAAMTTRQRQALLDAAKVADLNVLSLEHATTLTALHYGAQKSSSWAAAGRHRLVVFDLGAGKLEVGVFEFANHPEGAKPKKAVSLGTMKVEAITGDPHGGRQYDALLARHFGAEYKKKSGLDVLAMKDNTGFKAVAKLMRSANKAKETLSANKLIQVAVEGIYEDQDFQGKITRDEFSAMAQPLVERSIATLTRALEAANVTIDQVDSLELMGGGSRVPVLQEALTKALGKPLGRTLNTDESPVQGATFLGARLSGTYQVRSFAVTEYHGVNVSFQLSGDESNPEPTARPLFFHSKLPSKKLITIFRKKNFNITLFERTLGEDGAEILTPMTMYTFEGVGTAFNTMGVGKEGAHNESKHSLEMKFRLSESGIVSLESATAKYDEVVPTVKRVKVKPPTVDTNATKNATTEEGEGDADAKDENKEDGEDAKEKTAEAKDTPAEPAADGAAAGENQTATPNATGTNGTANTTVQYREINTTKTISHREPLSWATNELSLPLPMSSQDIINAQANLTRLRKRDEEKRIRAEAKNNLETLLYDTKYDKFLEDEDLKAFYNETEAERLREVLRETEEWLEEGDGMDATAKEYKKKGKYVRSFTDPIHRRREDFLAEKKRNETAPVENATETNATAEGEEGEGEAAAEGEEGGEPTEDASKETEEAEVDPGKEEL